MAIQIAIILSPFGTTNSNLPSEVNLKIEFYEKVPQFLKNEHFTG